ncbi:hypothetical protein WP4W18E05_08840 [Klebsiella sp. WP4-W18-ESBL-05]|nr:hypothetical protein WP4W18E05_08840 [Klebsiella sp. WP4-W18-ESBL-05]
MKQQMQMIGQAMLVPISIITIGSMFMGFGSALTNKETLGNDSNLMIVFYVQIMPDDLVMQLHRF